MHVLSLSSDPVALPFAACMYSDNSVFWTFRTGPSGLSREVVLYTPLWNCDSTNIGTVLIREVPSVRGFIAASYIVVK